jgi:hypothetical protein
MPHGFPDVEPRYTATVRDVAEVGLVGAADLGRWRAWLEPEGLFPVERDGAAEVRVMACSTRFKGIRFRELSISVTVSATDGAEEDDGVFLAQAWNSVRFFAWVERTFFRTPYQHADVELDSRGAAWMHVEDDAGHTLHAKMATSPSCSPSDVNWAGAIHLPRAKDGAPRRHFFARLAGPTWSSAFAEDDELAFGGSGVLARLSESGFVGRTWENRSGAVHARSKTFES